MTIRKSQSLMTLLREVERTILINNLSPDELRQYVQTLCTVLQAGTQTIVRSLPALDMREIRGINHAKRALEVAAAGGHHILLFGPHQAGKTLLARALPSIFPATEVPYPFRESDCRSNQDLFIGHSITPGELTLAHGGGLFLKNVHDFEPFLLEMVHRAVETHVVAFPNGEEPIHFPANFLLIATTMPCPCGFYGDSLNKCSCSPEMIDQHRQHVKTSIAACFALQVEVPRVQQDILSRYPEESSDLIRGRVEQARLIQWRRFRETAHLQVNADLGEVSEVQRYCLLDPLAEKVLRVALRQLHPSPQNVLHMQRVARTIADLAGSELIMAQHLAEAIQYRPRLL